MKKHMSRIVLAIGLVVLLIAIAVMVQQTILRDQIQRDMPADLYLPTHMSNG